MKFLKRLYFLIILTINALSAIENNVVLLLPTTQAETDYQVLGMVDLATGQLGWITTVTSQEDLELLYTATSADIPLTLVLRDDTGSFAASDVTVQGLIVTPTNVQGCIIFTDSSGDTIGNVCVNQQAMIIAPVAPRALQASNDDIVRGVSAVDLQMSYLLPTQVASGDYAVITGGQNNSVTGAYSVVSGGLSNIVSGSYATISGGNNNQVSGNNSFIGAGMFNSVTGNYATVVSGTGNSVSLDYSAIMAGQGNTLNGYYSFIGSGQNNLISALLVGFPNDPNSGSNAGNNAAIVCGENNMVSGFCSCICSGINNVTSGAFSGIVSGSANQVTNSFSAIGSGVSQIVSGSCSFIGGGQYNNVSGGLSGILSGSNNTVPGALSAIGGGQNNTVSGANSFVGAGFQNTISVNAVASGIVSGSMNTVNGPLSAIGSGLSNTLSGSASFIGAGTSNTITIGAYASGIIGGASNTVSNNYSSIGAGQFNTNAGNSSFIGAGVYNTIANGAFCSAIVSGSVNQVSSSFSTIAGGQSNIVTGTYSFIGAGTYNTVSGSYSGILSGSGNTVTGNYSAVLGGQNCSALGNYSIAAGTSAVASNTGNGGIFIWTDNSNSSILTATIANSFIVRAAGGAIFFSNDLATAGVALAANGGSWGSISDKNMKENFKEINNQEILQKLSTLPVTEWNYITQDPSIRHIGPMAQDFAATFGYYEDERYINTSDALGVLFAAAQGLYALQKQHPDNHELEQKIEALEIRVEECRKKQLSYVAKIVALKERLKKYEDIPEELC